MVILQIEDKNTKESVLETYTNRELNLNECVIKEDEQLLIRYAGGTYFKHEQVLKVTYPSKTSMIIETTDLIWTLG